MASCEIPESRKEKNRNELNLEDDDQAAPQPLDDGKVETASLISSMKEEAPTTETEAEAEVEVEAAEDAVEDDEEEDDNLSLSDLTCSSSGAEEEADEDAFAIDEASLVGVMEPCRQKKAADGDELAAQDDLEKEQLEHIVSLCQIIRQRLANISAQLQRRTEELDEKILARQKERDLQKNKNRLHL
ncbi:hypothetical protein KR067_007815 [Drosophila pandora]|nr:hypothetical protein KR067_007815 [Drosophila pandora]